MSEKSEFKSLMQSMDKIESRKMELLEEFINSDDKHGEMITSIVDEIWQFDVTLAMFESVKTINGDVISMDALVEEFKEFLCGIYSQFTGKDFIPPSVR